MFYCLSQTERKNIEYARQGNTFVLDSLSQLEQNTAQNLFKKNNRK